MALSPKTTLTQPIQIGLTAGSDSGVALLIGSGSPDGNTDPWSSAGKGSLHIRIDQTDDYSPLYVKVDADGADDDWVPTFVESDSVARTLKSTLTMDVDKKLFFRDSDNFMHSNAASYIALTAPSGVDVSKLTVGSGTYYNSFLAGSGTIVYGALVAGATSTACLSISGLTQEHKIFLAPSSMSGCLIMNGWSCSPGGGLLALTVANSGSETTPVGNVVFGYTAFAACGP